MKSVGGHCVSIIIFGMNIFLKETIFWGVNYNYRVTQQKMIHSVLQLKSVVEVGLNFSMGVSESEF